MLTSRVLGTQSAKDGPAHHLLRCGTLQPDFPLGESLLQKHLHAAYGLDALLRRDFEQTCALGTIDEIHYHAAVQLAGLKRRLSFMRTHSHRRSVDNHVERPTAQSVTG